LGAGDGGATAQADNRAISANGAQRARRRDNPAMWLILLEALGAGLVLVLIVWWTMFSGRRGGERSADDEPPAP